MKHKIYVLTNNQHEAYIMVRKDYFTLEWFKDIAFRNDVRFEKKSGVLARFIRENLKNGLELDRIDIDDDFTTLREVLDYRASIIEQYNADGYIVLDEKSDNILEASADANFGEVLKRMDVPKAVKVFGPQTLISARKALTVGEFLEKFAA